MRRRQSNEAIMPLLDHLKALRKVLLISAYAVAAGSLVGWIYSDPAFAYLAIPITNLEGEMFITTTPMEPVLVKLKMSIILGMLMAMPIIFWQIWSFILPALKQNEKKILYFVVPCSLILFFSGAAFCFYFVVPIGIKFLLSYGSAAVQSTAFVTKTSYLSFIITFLITFGLVFQIPIVLSILMRIGVIAPKTLAKKRKWAFFLIILSAAIVSPTPDLISQGLMVLPMYLLYEISIWLGYLIVRRRDKGMAA